jgi:bidirectional [NiFe] hydrogenase diaphorase subunit
LTQKVKVRIDGEVIAAPSGQTILEVARANSKYIPALCYMDGLSAVGACRLCMVEVSGVARLLPACTTPVQEGLAVTTSSPQLTSYRRIALELLFSERNHVCAVCVSSGHCELQSLAQEHGITHVRYPYNYPRLAVDTTHPRYVLDHNRCVLCSRCVRACAEIEGAHVWDVASRGIQARLVSELARPWGEAKTCTSCGK